ncbi:restriction endonuclease [Sutcliffiella horikoshii]|uniref:restriction endonuclease n=1 Tax=Sutcliffiella horikoshii TaxID=79883 RepID=UPI00384C4AD0
MKPGFITQKALSKKVGWSEANGRRWIKIFKQFIPVHYDGINKYFYDESYKVVSIIKELSDNGYTSTEILELFNKHGVNGALEAFNKNQLGKKDDIIQSNSLPTQKELTIAILKYISDKKPYTTTMINEGVSSFFSLTDEQKNITYPADSREFIFAHRMRLARYSLKKQEYIEEVSKYTYQITDDGYQLLNDDYETVKEEINELENVINPFDIIRDKVNEIENDLINDLIDYLKQAHWRRLETIVVELLTAMGYGDGQVTEKTNDGGLDGIIKEDKLGLDNIYIQAKKWEKTVGRPEVMSFSGALDAKGARKGIFITTSNFTRGAEEYVQRLESKKIILIDGKKLARLMIENNIGVSVKKKFVVKEVDFSYFEGE